ncbi:hypothetical protein F5B20DRAFT_558990 [Whalleya microplaca]|nr:hypothetical protein F5B20DRAFT_558990 [Whalleya microplaca]
MAVSQEQAREWDNWVPSEYSEYFADERTKSWETRRDEYRKRQAQSATAERVPQSTSSINLEYFRKRRIGTEFHGFSESHPSCLSTLKSINCLRCIPKLLGPKINLILFVLGILWANYPERENANSGTVVNLPSEVRDKIYEYRLVPGTVWMPNISDAWHVEYNVNDHCDHTGDRYQRYQYIPANWGRLYVEGKRLGLICGVSHNVQEEATKIFYSRNRFVFPYGKIGPWSPLSDKFYIYTKIMKAQLQDVSHTFDMREEAPSDYAIRHLLELNPDENEGVAAGLNKPAFMRKAHDFKATAVRYRWNERVRIIKYSALNRLQISFEECYCRMGCCRSVLHVLNMITNPALTGEWNVHPPKIIEVTGWNDEDEKSMIKQALEKLSTHDTKVRVQFVGKSKT